MSHIRQLEERLCRADSETERIDIANELAHELRNIDEERSIALTEENFRRSQELHYEKGIAYGYRNRGFCKYYAVDYDASLSNLYTALEKFEALDDQAGQANVLLWLGVVLNNMGDSAGSLDYYTQSLRLSEGLNDKRSIARVLTNIGSVYALNKDNVLALKYFTEGLEYSREIEDPAQEATALNGLGRIHNSLGNHEKALEYEMQALDLRQQIGDVRGMASSLFFVGRIHEKIGNTEEALRLYLSLYNGAQTNGFNTWIWGKAQIALAIAKMYNLHGELENSFTFAKTALEIAVTIKAQKIESEAHYILAGLFKKLEDFKEAFMHLERYNILNEAITGEELTKSTQTLERVRALRESEILRSKNTELARLNEELSQANEEAEALNQHLIEVNRNLEIVNQEKNEFLGIAAHDLKNPLASIILLTDFLKYHREKLTGEEIDKRVIAIQSTAERMSEIVTNLLGANAIENGKLFFNFEAVNISDLAEALIGEYASRAAAKHIRLSLEDKSEGTRMVADRNAIYEVLENLLSNAVKYSPSDTTVTVRILKNTYATELGEQGLVRIEVQDEGPGISASDKKYLFKKFARLSAKPTGGESSTGLGLSIAKKMTESMEGQIFCESELGNGATFIVEFPAAESEPAAN